MFQSAGLWHDADVSLIPRLVATACAALGLSHIVAIGRPATPVIPLSDLVAAGAGEAAPKIVFAPPSPQQPIRPETFPTPRFVITPAEAAAERSNMVALALVKAPDARTEVGAPLELEAPNASAETRGAAPAAAELPKVSFSIPPYKATTRERETVAACLVLEAASQGDFGMRAVMAVIRNRARGLPELFAPAVLRPKQFSALNKVTAGRESLPGAISRARRDRMWPRALAIVEDAMRDSWYDPTGGATHYTRSAERTHWTRSLAKTTTIGAHSFYR